MVDLDRMTIERAARGDQKAFRALYELYAPFVWRVVYRSAGGDRDAVEEIVQETFVRISQSLKKFTAESSLGTWIYRIAFNSTRSFWAKRAKERERSIPLITDKPDPVSSVEAFESGDMVERILGDLSAEERFLLIAREVDGLSFDEIAEISGKSSASLRTRMSRIKSRLSSMIDDSPYLKEAVS